MRLTKIYTKVGDHGETMLASGAFVPKTHSRIEAYGTVDELNSFMGLLTDELLRSAKAAEFAVLAGQIRHIQNELFDIGGELATPAANLDIKKQQVVTMAQVTRLEQEIDGMNATLKPLANFVLPGGHPANSIAHVARTVCRRAERASWHIDSNEAVREDVKIYLNRLSDWLFVVSRFISSKLGVAEIMWAQKR